MAAVSPSSTPAEAKTTQNTAEPAGPCCAACGEEILTCDGKSRSSGVPHACKHCKHDLHSWLHCDAVWMPIEDYYFCSPFCIKKYNTEQRQIWNDKRCTDEPLESTWADMVKNASLCPLVRTPIDEALVTEACFEDEGKKKEAGGKEVEVLEVPHDNQKGDVEHHQAHDDEVNIELRTSCNNRLEDEETRNNVSNVGDTVNEDLEILDVVLELTKRGARVKMAFQQHDTDTDGVWFGGVVGSTQITKPFSLSIVAIGYDDGALVSHNLAELQVKRQGVCGCLAVSIV